MKKFIISIIFALSVLTMNATTYVNNTFNNLNNIEEVIVNVPAHIYLFNGDKFEIGIQSKNKNLYDAIKYEIDNNTLYINVNEYVQYYLEEQGINATDLKINIKSPNKIQVKTNSDLLAAKIYKNKKATNNENE